MVEEWLAQAHGTRYVLQHEPFVAFDVMRGQERAPLAKFTQRVQRKFVVPHLLDDGGGRGAMDGPEGAVLRLERQDKVER